MIFFFSSRRRHTRCSRDWSSDVCSSDLEWPLAQAAKTLLCFFCAVPCASPARDSPSRSEEHTSELQSRLHLVCRLLLEKKKKVNITITDHDNTLIEELVRDSCYVYRTYH